MEKKARFAHLMRHYIRCRKINEARTLIKNVSPTMRKEIVSASPNYHVDSAFGIAVKDGSVDCLKFLANECGGDFDEKVCVRQHELRSLFDKRTGDKWMSPLEIAIRSDRTDSVEFLVSIGADVDHVAKNGTNMFIACHFRSFKTVQMLLDHGADVNASDEDGNTCLMSFSFDVKLCRLLIDKGADLDRRNNRGSTALQFAASANLLETVKLLLERGANPICITNEGYDCLEVASLTGSESVMKYLIETGSMDVKRQIEAYHLLGVGYGAGINRAGCYVMKALSAWRKAIQLTSESGIVSHAATLDTPFGIVIEATTIAELENLGQDRIQISMQCMVLASKIFDKTHNLFFETVNTSMWRFFESGSYDRYLQLLIYFFRMTQSCNFERRCLEVEKMCSCTAEFFVKFVRINFRPKLNFQLILDFTKAVVEEAAKCTQVDLSTKYMTVILNAVSIFHISEFEKDQVTNFRKLVYSAIKLGLNTSDGGTILVTAMSRFPSYATVEHHVFRLRVIETLLECGADANETDVRGNTAVHFLLLAPYEALPDQIKKLALAFVNKGIHLDARNDSGVTVSSVLLKLGLDIKPPINLMCLAARVIRRSNIPVEGILPKHLVTFVKMH